MKYVEGTETKETNGTLSVIGSIEIPPLMKLRDANGYTPTQYYAKRDGPVFVFKGEPFDENIIINGGTLTGKIIFKEDERKYVSRKVGMLVGSKCVDENMENVIPYSFQGSAQAGIEKTRIVIRIYVFPLQIVKHTLHFREFSIRNTGRGGYDSSNVESAQFAVMIGKNRTPSETHGANYWYIEGPATIKTTTRGNGENSTYSSNYSEIFEEAEVIQVEGSDELRSQVNGVWQHKHEGYYYWHPMARVHKCGDESKCK